MRERDPKELRCTRRLEAQLNRRGWRLVAGWGDAVEFQIPHRSVIHCDARSASIGAASILAKVARDTHLRKLHRLYPQYQLAKNKGYGTPEHLAGLARYGPCPEHRRTFQPVRASSLPLFPASPGPE